MSEFSLALIAPSYSSSDLYIVVYTQENTHTRMSGCTKGQEKRTSLLCCCFAHTQGDLKEFISTPTGWAHNRKQNRPNSLFVDGANNNLTFCQ